MTFDVNIMNRKSFLVSGLLCFFLGAFGVHRFYTGYIGIGIAQLLTLGGCGIWTMIDMFAISLNKYKDAKNQELEDYIPMVGYIIIGIMVFSIVLNILNMASGIQTMN